MRAKVLFVTTVGGFIPQFKMGDVDILQKHFCEIHYASNFHRAIYACDQVELQKKGVILHQLNIQKSPLAMVENVRAMKQLTSIIDEEGIDIVHCHNPMGGVVARMAGRCAKKSPYMIYTAHGFHFYQGAPFLNRTVFYGVEKLLASYTDCLITINQEDYDAARRMLAKKGGYGVKIPGVGLDTEKFQRREFKRDEMRHKLGIPRDGFHIVSVGELNDNKNHQVLIRAVDRLLRDERVDQPIYLTICGRGPREDELRTLIQQCGLDEYVYLAGYREDVCDVLQAADCFAFPSVREGLGMAALEAMACELPVIAAENRGTIEFVEAGRNGILCEAKSVDAFANAMKLLMEDEELRSAMGHAGRKTACRFSKEEADKVMESVYKRALDITTESRG